MKIEIDINKIIENQRENLKNNIENFAKVIKDKVDEKTPEDTKKLLGNNQIGLLTEIGSQVGIRVFNDTEYASYVEYGVGIEFKYNKPKGNIFYEGVGAGMFGRTWQEYKNKFVTKN